MVTYRRFSHTDKMGYPRLDECPPPTACGYQQEAVAIIPVVLATGPCIEEAGAGPLPTSSCLKAPTVPVAPGGLPEEFDLCVQEDGGFIRHRDPGHKLHGAQVSAECWTDEETGMRMCRIDVGGDAEMVVPGCLEEGVEKEELPDTTCVNIDTSTLVAPGSSYDGLVVKIVTEHEVEGIMEASVAHPDLPGGEAQVLICEKMEPEKEEAPCCIDEKTGQIICPESSVLAAYHGMLIPLEYLDCKDGPNGGRICIMKCGESSRPKDKVEKFLQHICEATGRKGFPVCEIPGDRPKVAVPRYPEPPPSAPPSDRRPPRKYLSPVPVPKKVPVPQLCCFNPRTSSLVCEGTPYDGLVVKLVIRVKLPSGVEVASVSHPSMPGGGARVPLCDEPPQRRPPVIRIPPPRKEPPPQLPPANCCVIESPDGLRLQCDPKDHPWNGRNVTKDGKCVDLPNGRICVLRWSDRDGDHVLEIPVCPPEAPPPVVRTPPPRREPPPRTPPPVVRIPPPRREPPPRTPPKKRPPSRFPEDICYNMKTGLLEAEGSKWHGTAVQPVSIGAIKDGVGMILVEHPKFVGGRASVPICGGSCYADSDPGRAYSMTYRGTPCKSDGGIRRYSGFSGDPSAVQEQRDAQRFMDGRNRSFLPNSPGPNIHLLHQANLPISPWGPVGHAHPPNITGNPAGYNTRLFQTDQQVVDALVELGYAPERGEQKFDFGRAVAQFQADYNAMSNSIPAKRRLQDVNWVRVPKGHVVADGMVGPVTMNALEIALVNQRGGVSWEEVILLMGQAMRGHPPKTPVYDARQRDVGRRHAHEPVGPRGISRRR